MSVGERRIASRPGTGHELLDRECELGVLRRLAGDGGVALVHGPAGIGKSALLAVVAAEAGADGSAVLWTSGVQAEAALPYAALERLLHGVRDRLEGLPESQRDALRAGLGMSQSAVPDQFLVGLAVLSLLSDVACVGRVVVVVDDAQWLDSASAEVFGFVARRIEAEPITLLVAQRDGGRDALQTAVHELAVDVSLAPLGDAAAATMLGRTGEGLSGTVRQRVLSVAAGNPLALAELPRSPGILESPPEPERVTLSQRLERSFGAQADDLPAAARPLLLVAAADDSEFGAEILAAARVVAPEAGEREVESAVALRMLERDGARLRFRHPLIRSAIYQAADGPSRRAAHAALAQVITDDPHRRAWHRAAATPPPSEEVAADLDAVAADARRRGALALAARALERAAAFSATAEAAVTRQLKAAELSATLGDLGAVGRLIAGAEALDPEVVADARVRWIQESLSADASADDVPVRILLTDAERAGAEGDSDLALKLLLAAGTRCWWALPAAAPIRDEIVAASLNLPIPEDDARVLAVLAATSAVRHSGLVIERLERSCAKPDLAADDAHLLGQAAHMVGEAGLAVRQLARVERQWRAQGRLAALAQALTMRAWSSIQLGNWPAVVPAAAEGDRLATETGQTLWAAGARAARAAAAGARGETELAATLASEIESRLVGSRPSNVLAVLQVARGVSALGAGRYAEAYDLLARMFDPDDPSHHYAECHGALSYLAEAALQCGRVDGARVILDQIAPLMDDSSSTLTRIGVQLAEPLLAGPERAETAFERALGGVVGTLPFHRGRLLLAQGVILRRGRRSADSREPLRAARDLFDALGTVPWAERARQELRASGESSRRRVPEARDQLTPQELQIAQLAADGLSNPEIGERLFLSARTVASHLYRAFPKLGISSRRELGPALGVVGDPT